MVDEREGMKITTRKSKLYPGDNHIQILVDGQVVENIERVRRRGATYYDSDRFVGGYKNVAEAKAHAKIFFSDDSGKTSQASLGWARDVKTKRNPVKKSKSAWKRKSKRTRRNPYSAIQNGDTITFLRYAGEGSKRPEYSKAKGRAVMRGPAGWVVNTGGRHGTPAIVDERNYVSGGTKGKRKPSTWLNPKRRSRRLK